MPRGQIPRRIKKKGTQFKGLSMRELMITVSGLALAIIVAMAVPGAVWIRAGLAVLIAGVALALAFGTHRGQTVEQLIARWISHRFLRPRNMVWRRGGDDLPDVQVETPEPRPAPDPGSAARPEDVEVPFRPATEDWLPLWYALVNAVMLAAMTSLTVYLADGGAEELRAWWEFKLR